MVIRMLHSRGRSAGNTYREPPTRRQKQSIAALARHGYTDRDIGERLGLTAQQVAHARHAMGIWKEQTGGRMPECIDRALRPSHVKGELFSEDWMRSQHEAFNKVAAEAYRTGQW